VALGWQRHTVAVKSLLQSVELQDSLTTFNKQGFTDNVSAEPDDITLASFGDASNASVRLYLDCPYKHLWHGDGVGSEMMMIQEQKDGSWDGEGVISSSPPSYCPVV
jgi:hypothetical protein